MKAIVEIKGHQYLVEENTIIDVDKFDPKTEKKELSKILLIENNEKVQIGTPYLKDSSLDVEVLEELKSPKEIVFKFKRKTGYKKKQGHRQNYVRLKIKKIQQKSASAKSSKKAEVKTNKSED